MLELLALAQLQVEDEARDALQLLTEILHFQLSYLGVYEHHELPRTAPQRVNVSARPPEDSACVIFSTLLNRSRMFSIFQRYSDGTCVCL